MSKNRHFIFLLVSVFLLSSCSLFPADKEQNINLNQNLSPSMTTKIPSQNLSKPTESVGNEQFVSLKTINGEIVIKLYSKETPNTVANFLNKVKSNFYNGLIFHRVIPGFMAQGGDPTGTGQGGNKQKSELNTLPFRRGSVGLARTADTRDLSNDSQFFICFTTQGCQHLTNDYVNFGEVVSGLDILDKIVQGDQIVNITAYTK